MAFLLLKVACTRSHHIIIYTNFSVLREKPLFIGFIDVSDIKITRNKLSENLLLLVNTAFRRT